METKQGQREEILYSAKMLRKIRERSFKKYPYLDSTPFVPSTVVPLLFVPSDKCPTSPVHWTFVPLSHKLYYFTSSSSSSSSTFTFLYINVMGSYLSFHFIQGDSIKTGNSDSDVCQIFNFWTIFFPKEQQHQISS